MGIKSTQTITRNIAITRMSYVIGLLEEGLYDEAEASELNQMLEEVMEEITNLEAVEILQKDYSHLFGKWIECGCKLYKIENNFGASGIGG